MCRHLAYLGPAATLASWLYDAPHALVHQAAAPREMRGGGTINADGFGVGWFVAPGKEPVRYRRDKPLWSDVDLPGLAAATTARAVVAAVRSATVGMPVTEAACAPFAGDGWLFSHNGRVVGWPESLATLAAELPVTQVMTMPAPTDSALLWALLRARLAAGSAPAAAVATIVSEVLDAAPGSRLNLLLNDGETIVATTVTHSLWVRRLDGGVVVCSEPLDEGPQWRPVPAGALVTATPDRVEITDIEAAQVPG
ncbi:ergothioneine biosynthesis protein EgtC [Natronosporangium hydrolyticum]|uniref:Gamma-glutamyl-hercynylcysteine sulfoxide hydrolase n=1 Tax=Natronosporangium hydrolyticum TaxID=2811111 RepID=A0A895YHZ6_9ACTN|nr:ergothioneine biosynthesis protein EgtC [Natronosporangium hydrolyticum]QSB15682.1 ergothioneine biosynthesis protein EgtC [Natronosporangium hydrolyticum]